LSQKETPLAPYQIISEAGRTDFIPTRSFVAFLVLMFLLGGAFSLYIGLLLMSRAPEWPALAIGGAFCFAAVTLLGLALWGWRTRQTPLSINPDGAVSYGSKLLCDPGAVNTVDVVPARGGEPGDCEVVLALKQGRQLTIPSQYFGSYKSLEHARPFAEALAQALAVRVHWHKETRFLQETRFLGRHTVTRPTSSSIRN
jgi:hypothetical protein